MLIIMPTLFLAIFFKSLVHSSPPGMLFFAVIGLVQLGPSDSAVTHGVMLHADSPIMTGAPAAVTASVTILHDSSGATTDPRSYRFHWIHTPLVLIEEYKDNSSSEIIVIAESPGSYFISVWVTLAGCYSCPLTAKNSTQLYVTDSLVGELKVTQAKANPMGRHGISLATDTLIQITFLRYDPSLFLNSASFTYCWDFGDGFQLITEEPSVSYNYSTPGAYSLQLEVFAELAFSNRSRHEGQFGQKTGHFSSNLNLLDPVTAVQIQGSTQTYTREEFSALLQVIGSPPFSLCWLLELECIPAEVDDCHLVVLNRTDFLLIHTFNNDGEYCLSVKVQNEISVLHSSYNITVRSPAVHSTLYVLPCIALFLMAMCFFPCLMFRSTYKHRRYQKYIVEVADFDFLASLKMNVYLQEEYATETRNSSCAGQEAQDAQESIEKLPLLHSPFKPVRTYVL